MHLYTFLFLQLLLWLAVKNDSECTGFEEHIHGQVFFIYGVPYF